MYRSNVYGSFVQALFFSGTVGVPKYFLHHYAELGLNPFEAMLIIHIIGEMDTNPYPTAPELAKRMNTDTHLIEEMLAKLISRNLIAIEKQWNPVEQKTVLSYNFAGLIDELAELWAIERVKHYEAEQNYKQEQVQRAGTNLKPSPNAESLAHIIRTFEQELGRPLTAIECEVINNWIAAKFSEELILEAFKRGVMAGIRNFRYIDSILREWEKKGLRTLQEVEADDAYFQAKTEKTRGKKGSAAQPKSKITPGKYDDFYLS